MDIANELIISNTPEISAIYFALLQCGYDYYAMDRSQKHNDRIKSFITKKDVPSFFTGVRQDTCDVYPYWPRAAILETASFYLLRDRSQFGNFDSFRSRIMAASNIADYERDNKFWTWISEFPVALSKVLTSNAFHDYISWEQKWLAGQNNQHAADLQLIKNCLDLCVAKYESRVQDIQIIISPIKCVYSADYHLIGNRFIFSSGAFCVDSVVHEFLHHVVHPIVLEIADMVLANKRAYPNIDKSYYLSGDNAGQINAFEEYAVRALTKGAMENEFPDKLAAYLRGLL